MSLAQYFDFYGQPSQPISAENLQYLQAKSLFISLTHTDIWRKGVCDSWCLLSKPKLYIPSTLNIDLILWHTQLIVCATFYCGCCNIQNKLKFVLPTKTWKNWPQTWLIIGSIFFQCYQLKSQFLFHKKCSLLDLCIMTLPPGKNNWPSRILVFFCLLGAVHVIQFDEIFIKSFF